MVVGEVVRSRDIRNQWNGLHNDGKPLTDKALRNRKLLAEFRPSRSIFRQWGASDLEMRLSQSHLGLVTIDFVQRQYIVCRRRRLLDLLSNGYKTHSRSSTIVRSLSLQHCITLRSV